MFKKHGKTILIIVLIIQIATPFNFFIYQLNLKNELENETEYIKLNINNIYINEDTIYINFNLRELFYSEQYYNYEYVVFEPTINNEYSEIRTSNSIPFNNKYINYESIYDLYYLALDDYCKTNNINYANLYNKEIELENVASGDFSGPLTEAYAILKIYKNQFKVVEIYIENYTLTEYIELYVNNKINISRYSYQSYTDKKTITKEDCLNVIDENKLYLYEDCLEKYTY